MQYMYASVVMNVLKNTRFEKSIESMDISIFVCNGSLVGTVFVKWSYLILAIVVVILAVIR